MKTIDRSRLLATKGLSAAAIKPPRAPASDTATRPTGDRGRA